MPVRIGLTGNQAGDEVATFAANYKPSALLRRANDHCYFSRTSSRFQTCTGCAQRPLLACANFSLVLHDRMAQEQSRQRGSGMAVLRVPENPVWPEGCRERVLGEQGRV